MGIGDASDHKESGKRSWERKEGDASCYSAAVQRVGQMKFMWLLVGFYLCATK